MLIHLIMYFKSSISFTPLSAFSLSYWERHVKICIYGVVLSTFSFSSVNFCLINFQVLLLVEYILIFQTFYWSFYHHEMPLFMYSFTCLKVNCLPAFFCLIFVRYTFSQTFPFNFLVSFCSKRVFCKQLKKYSENFINLIIVYLH